MIETSRDRYRNCFYYYRGGAKGGKEAAKAELRERQFEDNTTKALINVLEHGGLLESFLRDVVGVAPNAASDAKYTLQGAAGGPLPTTRILLGISALGEIDPALWSVAEQPNKGRVDASVVVPDQVAVFIETKVTEYLDGPQLNRHAKDWGVPEAAHGREIPSQWRLVTWAAIYRWARSLTEKLGSDSVPGFLSDQFRSYLELTGLAPFSGFQLEHFNYFMLSVEERQSGEQAEVADQIKARLDGIWGVIKEQSPGTYARLGEIRVGRLKAEYDHAFAETHSGSGKPNLTIELGADEFQLNLVGWDANQSSLIEKWLRSDAGRSDLRSLDGFELIPFRRRAKTDHKGSPFWMGAIGTLIERVEAPSAAVNIDELLAEWKGSLDPVFERIAFHIRRSWLPTEVAGKGSAFVPSLINEIGRLLPTLDRIRGD